jgi:hypothetical protein
VRGAGGPRDGAPAVGCARAGMGWSRACSTGGARAQTRVRGGAMCGAGDAGASSAGSEAVRGETKRSVTSRHARRSCGGKLLREMRERDGHIEDAAKVFDEMPMRAVPKDAVGWILRRCAEQRCAGAA